MALIVFTAVFFFRKGLSPAAREEEQMIEDQIVNDITVAVVMITDGIEMSVHKKDHVTLKGIQKM